MVRDHSDIEPKLPDWMREMIDAGAAKIVPYTASYTRGRETVTVCSRRR